MDDDSTGFYSNFSILHVWEFLHWCAFKGEGLGYLGCYAIPRHIYPECFWKMGGEPFNFHQPGEKGRLWLGSTGCLGREDVYHSLPKKNLRTDNPRNFLGSWTSVLIQYLTDPSRIPPSRHRPKRTKGYLGWWDPQLCPEWISLRWSWQWNIHHFNKLIDL